MAEGTTVLQKENQYSLEFKTLNIDAIGAVLWQPLREIVKEELSVLIIEKIFPRLMPG
jgi:hypothetical protein